MSSQTAYRPDIDGLRAVAVLSVVVFHTFPSLMPGGFVGVDVFFVISGYLISSLILRNLVDKTFNFAEFYMRRIRRIFPALLLVLWISYTIGFFYLSPSEYRQLGEHVAGSAGFISNIILWRESGYFDSSADFKPLLHLWSLGVEEQFYIVWPFLLLLACQLRLGFPVVITLISTGSFLLCIIYSVDAPTSAFYLPQARFWELSSGGLLAWWQLRRCSSLNRLAIFRVWALPNLKWRHWLANASSCAGSVCLLVACWQINKNLSFPGFLALLPVVGSLLIIFAGERAWINRYILSNRLLVFLGLLSFPLYLWHWPLLVFTRIAENGIPSVALRFTILMVSTVLAWLTYHFVERPIRKSEWIKHISVLLIVLMLATGYIGYSRYNSSVAFYKFPKIIYDLTEYQYDYVNGYRYGTCFLRPEQSYKDFIHCEDQRLAEKKTILLWGDSHAAHLYPGFREELEDKFNLIQRTASGCPPFVGMEILDRVQCKGINDGVLTFAEGAKPDIVVLAAAWHKFIPTGITPTIQRLRSAGINNIVVVGPVPIWLDSLPKLLFTWFKNNKDMPVPFRTRLGLDSAFISIDEKLKRDLGLLDVIYVSPQEALCSIEGCIVRTGDVGDTLTLWDQEHLTKTGSVLVVKSFGDLLTAADRQ